MQTWERLDILEQFLLNKYPERFEESNIHKIPIVQQESINVVKIFHSKYEKLLNWLDKLNDIEFEVTVNTLLKPEEKHTIANLNRSSFLGTMQTWQRLDILEKFLLDRYPERFAEQPNSFEFIPFTNQENIIWPIISEHSRPYHILDAPAGYGKTALLLELKRRLEKEFWCVYVSTARNKTITGLIKALFEEFSLTVPPIADNFSMSPNELEVIIGKLGNELKKKHNKKSKNGFVILIDIEKIAQPEIEILSNGIESLINTLHRSLQADQYLRSKPNALRVIIGGRYLARNEDLPLTKQLPFQVHKLSLFSYDILLQWVTSSDSSVSYLANDELKHLSAHIMYLSGGHPGAIAPLLEKYSEGLMKPDAFLSYNRHDIEHILNEQINQIISDIPLQLQNVMSTLSPCRRVTPRFLGEFMIQGLIEGGDGYALADELTMSYLMTYDDGFLQGGVTRGVLAFGLRQTQLKHFIHICQTAKQIYQNDLSKPNISQPIIVAIELLYQELQLAYYQSNHNTAEERKKLADKFFGSILEDCLSSLTDSRDARDVIANFRGTLRKDVEFQFTLNYFLRGVSYNEEPYMRLRYFLDKYYQSLH